MFEDLIADLSFCIDHCEMSDDQITDIIGVCDDLGGIRVEYFMEEFIVLDNKQIHEDDYLDIDVFNSLHF